MIKKLFNDYSHRLQQLYPKQEAESLVYWLFEHFFGLKRMDILQEKPMSEIPEALEEALTRLMEGVPIQYITRSAPFYGRDFIVSPSVLIPRNETEELVHLIIRENKTPGLIVMDIGTGSGCIPITLALEMAQPKVAALDISNAALDVAKLNAANFKTKIDLYQVDILQEDFPIDHLDILVSNPPYVRDSEKALMHANVLQHEPHLALFVPDDDPLVFYKKIAEKGYAALKSGGKLYFEINETLGHQVVELLTGLGFREIRLLKDLNDRDRIVTSLK